MKKTNLNLVILFAVTGYLFLVFGLDIFPSAKEIFTPKSATDIQCQADSDCVPLPVCRPQHCVNKNSAEKYQLPVRDDDGKISMPIPSNDSWLRNNAGCLKMYYGPQVEERTAGLASCVCNQSACYNLRKFFSVWRFSKFIPFGPLLLLLPLLILSSLFCRTNLNSWKIKNHFLAFIASLLIYIVAPMVFG